MNGESGCVFRFLCASNEETAAYFTGPAQGIIGFPEGAGFHVEEFCSSRFSRQFF